jgi:hypothetical protein
MNGRLTYVKHVDVGDWAGAEGQTVDAHARLPITYKLATSNEIRRRARQDRELGPQLRVDAQSKAGRPDRLRLAQLSFTDLACRSRRSFLSQANSGKTFEHKRSEVTRCDSNDVLNPRHNDTMFGRTVRESAHAD